MKIGLIGGYGHECVKLYPGAELAWACDDYDDKALERAEKFGNHKTYPSIEAMLGEFKPDVVYIGSVFAENGRLAARMLEQGFDVVAEKPLATDRETLERLRELTRSGERRVIAEFASRWGGPVEKVRELIQAGAIGEPVLVQAQKTYKFGNNRPDFYKERALFGGIIPWVAIHAIDYSAFCTGLRYEAVNATQGNRCFPDYAEMEDHAAMLFQMTGGVPAVITADFLRPPGAPTHSDNRLRVTGSAGGVVEMRDSDIFLINDEGEHHWSCETTEAHGVQRAKDLVDAALGTGHSWLDTEQSLHMTEAALAAREAADAQGSRLVRIGA